MHWKVIHKQLNKGSNHFRKYAHDQIIESTSRITQTKTHASKCKSSKRTSECCFLLVLRCKRNLIIFREPIKKIEMLFAFQSIDHLIDEREQEVVFASDNNKIFVVDAHSSSNLHALWNQLLLLILYVVIQPFFGTKCTRLTHLVSEIG